MQAALDEAVAGVKADVQVGLNLDEFDAQVDEVRAKLDELDGRRVEAELGLSKDTFDADADDASARLDEFGAKHVDAELGLDKADFDAEADDATAKLDDLETPRETTLGMDKADFDAEADDAEARLDELEVPRKASLSLDTSGGSGGGGDSGGGLLGSIPGGMWTLIGGGLTAAAPGLAGAAAGLGLLGGTAGLAFGGITKALSAHSQASQSVGQTGAQLAATAFSNAVQIQQAQATEQQAYEQAAEAASQSAAQIESAKTNEAETVRNAAQSQAQALQAVTQAQQQEQQSVFGLSTAQYNLSNAWIQARYQLQQLNDAERNSATTIKAARLAVEQAQYQQKLTDENAMSTSLDRQQAAIAVTQAQEGLTAAQQQATYTGQEANLQDKAGVAGSQTVLAAKEAVKQAIWAVRDAAKQEELAQKNLTDTELNNAAAIKQAQLAVTQAEQQAAYQQEQSARAIAQAVQNVSNTYKEQKLQAAATLSSSNQAANQFARDMGRLSPAARGFVRELLSMHGAWRTLEDDAQNAVMPGMTIFLSGIKSILPEIDRGVTLMGHAMSSAFGQFGRLMQTSAFREGLAGLIRNGVQFASTVLPAFAQFLQELGKVGGESGAVTGLSKLLAGLGHGLSNIVKATGPFRGALSSALSAIGKALEPVGTLIGKVVGSLGSALAPALKALLPGFSALAGALGTGLSAALTGLAPLLQPFATAISDIVVAVAPLLPSLGRMIAQFAQGLAPMLTSMLPLVRQLASIFEQQMQAGLQQMLGSLTPLVPAIGKLITSFMPLITWTVRMAGDLLDFSAKLGGPVTDALVRVTAVVIDVASKWQDSFHFIAVAAEYVYDHTMGALKAGVTSAFHDLGDAAMFLWHDVYDPMWHGIEAGASFLWQDVILPMARGIETAFQGIETAAMWMWHNVFDPVWQGIEAGARGFVSGFETVWSRLEGIFKTPVNFLIKTVYDNGIRRFWNDIVGAVGLKSLDLPVVAALAGGGIVPGRDTGRDNRLVAMRSGEGVLQPGAVRAIGPGTVHALNARYGDRPAGGAQSGVLPAFSGGGWLGDIGSFFTGIGRGIADSAKFVAELATDPAKAISDLLSKKLGTDATGQMAKVMEAIPKTLIGDLVKSFLGATASRGGGPGGPLPGGGSGAVGNLPANWHTIASFLAGHGFTKYAAAGVAGNVLVESGGNPEILEIGGGGGGGLIQWTPYPAGYITGNYMRDLGVQLNAILGWGGGPGTVNKATSPSNAALIYQDLYERPASLTQTIGTRMAGANAVYRAMGWGKFDQGGYLMPMGMPGGMPGVNTTGQPEAVLTPQQTQALITVAESLTRNGGRGPAGGQVVVNQNYLGPMMPNPEQQAIMRRDLALSLSSG